MSADSFHDFVRELFAGLGRVQVKRMFGGAGVYAEGVMFALLAQETIYINVDDALKVALREQGGAPFMWTPKSGPRQGEHVDMWGIGAFPILRSMSLTARRRGAQRHCA